jgi:hypothetical protein
LNYNAFIDNIGFWVVVNKEDFLHEKWQPRIKGWATDMPDNELLQYCTAKPNGEQIIRIFISISRPLNGNLINVHSVEKLFFELLGDKILNPHNYISQIKVRFLHLTYDHFITTEENLFEEVGICYLGGNIYQKDKITTCERIDTDRKEHITKYINGEQLNSIVFSDDYGKRSKRYITAYNRKAKHGGKPCLRLEAKATTYQHIREYLSLPAKSSMVYSEVLNDSGYYDFTPVFNLIQKRYGYDFAKVLLGKRTAARPPVNEKLGTPYLGALRNVSAEARFPAWLPMDVTTLPHLHLPGMVRMGITVRPP